jgi:hypothetical protein
LIQDLFALAESPWILAFARMTGLGLRSFASLEASFRSLPSFGNSVKNLYVKQSLMWRTKSQ